MAQCHSVGIKAWLFFLIWIAASLNKYKSPNFKQPYIIVRKQPIENNTMSMLHFLPSYYLYP